MRRQVGEGTRLPPDEKDERLETAPQEPAGDNDAAPTAAESNAVVAKALVPGPPMPEDGDTVDSGASTTPTTRGWRPGYGSARARAARNRLVDDVPGVRLPAYFVESNVRLHDPNATTASMNGERLSTATRSSIEAELRDIASPRDGETTDDVWDSLVNVLDAASWNVETVDAAVRARAFDEIARRGDVVRVAATSAAMVQDGSRLKLAETGDSLPVDSLRDYAPSLLSDYFLDLRSQDPDAPPRRFVEQVEHFIRTGLLLPEIDAAVWSQITSTVRGALNAGVPSAASLSDDVRRPVTTVFVPNYKGRAHARLILDRLADEIGADIVRLDAQDIALAVGENLGQTVAWSQGGISQLGYEAAEISGRLLKQHEWRSIIGGKGREDVSFVIRNRRDEDDEDVSEVIFSARRDKGSYKAWDKLKIKSILDKVVQSADSMTHPSTKHLIIHVEDYLELSMMDDGARILAKLRETVDRAWRSGKSVVMVGTSSTNHISLRYSKTLDELSPKDHIIVMPLIMKDKRVVERLEAWERHDYWQQNAKNLTSALQMLCGTGEPIQLQHAEPMAGILGTAVLPRSAINHLAMVMLGLRSTRPDYLGPDLLADALELLSSADYFVRRNFWQGIASADAGMEDAQPVQASYPFAPFMPESQSSLEPSSVESSDHAVGSGRNNWSKPVTRAHTEHEKRLLSGLIRAESIRTTFDDVHAPAETIESLKSLTSLALLRPDAFSYGVLASERIPGCLLYGPPGTGKTLLAKAVAKESGASMLEVSGASIMDMYVGESEKNVRAVFSLARKLAPLVIFIDEADALLGTRSHRQATGHRETINQFLREWDGLTTGSNANAPEAFIMVATNRPFDLDDAVLRRLPRRLLVDLPTRADRAAILRILLRDETLDPSDPDLTPEDLARRTPSYSGSDLKNLCVAAAMAAVREEMALEAAASAAGPVMPFAAPERGSGATDGSQQQQQNGQPDAIDVQRYVRPPKRILARRHFDKALREIGASVSEDMATLNAIRKFDEQYGDARARRRKRVMGFEPAWKPDQAPADAEEEGGLVRRGR